MKKILFIFSVLWIANPLWASKSEDRLFWTHCLVPSQEPFFFLRTTPAIWSGPDCLLVIQYPGDPKGVFHTFHNPLYPDMLPFIPLKHIHHYPSFFQKFVMNRLAWWVQSAAYRYLTFHYTKDQISLFNVAAVNFLPTFWAGLTLTQNILGLPWEVLFSGIRTYVQYENIQQTTQNGQKRAEPSMFPKEKIDKWIRRLGHVLEFSHGLLTEVWGELLILNNGLISLADDPKHDISTYIKWYPKTSLEHFDFSEDIVVHIH